MLANHEAWVFGESTGGSELKAIIVISFRTTEGYIKTTCTILLQYFLDVKTWIILSLH